MGPLWEGNFWIFLFRMVHSGPPNLAGNIKCTILKRKIQKCSSQRGPTKMFGATAGPPNLAGPGVAYPLPHPLDGPAARGVRRPPNPGHLRRCSSLATRPPTYCRLCDADYYSPASTDGPLIQITAAAAAAAAGRVTWRDVCVADSPQLVSTIGVSVFQQGSGQLPTENFWLTENCRKIFFQKCNVCSWK